MNFQENLIFIGIKYERTKTRTILMSTPNIIYAKQFLRSCRLIDGILIEEN